VFVGGLPHGVTDDQIKQFFSRYGMVKEFKMMYDENKQRPRGFGFITFELEESANQVLQEHYIQFNGKQIEVKPQIHNIKQQNPYHNQMQHHQMQQHQQQAQHHHPSQYNSGGVNWNQSWNQSQPQLANSAPNNGSWTGGPGAYGNQMAAANQPGISQQWGYPGSQSVPYANTGAGNGASVPQSNWNYSYYGQPPQQNYYQADSAGTGTFNF